jgi:sterol desaturase/sphingolipid hydroxylase (fatty acid hydroxylase superfamily)
MMPESSTHNDSSNKKADTASQKYGFFSVALASVGLLLIPFIAMQFTHEVNWGIADFVLISRRTQRKYQVLIAMILAAVFLYIWAELAVGVFTDLGS